MIDVSTAGLKLSEEEAYAILSLCLTSPTRIDSTSEKALRKLAAFCCKESNHKNHKNSADVRQPVGA